MNLHSCANCLHNGLQYDSIGSRLGYCTLHQFVLRKSDHLTCGQQRRKDLLQISADRAAKRQCELFPAYEIVRVDGERLNGSEAEYLSKDRSLLQETVSATVAEYRRYARIATFAQLRRTPGARADLALASLGRVYVKNCMTLDQKWTTGINLFWWVRERCENETEPDLRYEHDIRYEMPCAPERQLGLAKGSLLMLRLSFLSDVGTYAMQSPQREEDDALVVREASERVATLSSLADDAAEATGTEWQQVRDWLRDVGLKRIDAALPRADYEAIQTVVHRDPLPQ